MNYDDQVKELVQMGFEEPISKAAITKSKGDIQEAINMYHRKQHCANTQRPKQKGGSKSTHRGAV